MNWFIDLDNAIQMLGHFGNCVLSYINVLSQYLWYYIIVKKNKYTNKWRNKQNKHVVYSTADEKKNQARQENSLLKMRKKMKCNNRTKHLVWKIV